MSLRIQRILYAVLLVAGQHAFAYDFSSADQLFAKRDGGAAQIEAARSAYREAAKQTAGEELIYAVEQVSRLFVYEALLIPTSQIKKRKPILEDCVKQVEAIRAGGSVPVNPEYYYWKVTCMAYWGEANGILASLGQARELVDLIDTGNRLNKNYEGGGFDRAAGVVYSKLPAFNPTGGPSGDPRRSFQHFRTALAAPAYEKARNKDTELGEFHFTNHYYFAEALNDHGHSQEARDILEGAIERIREGEVPPGREPETRLVEKMMRDLLSRL